MNAKHKMWSIPSRPARWGAIFSVAVASLTVQTGTSYQVGVITGMDPCAPWTAAALDSTYRSLYEAKSFVAMMQRRGNDDGEISWQVSYLLMADAAMIRATGSGWYAEQARALATEILASTDSARGVRDWRGRSGHGWSETRYTKDSARVREPVGEGMVAYALADAAAASHDVMLRDGDSTAARWWVAVGSAVHDALQEDRQTWKERDGRMLWPDSFPAVGDRAEVPINQDVIFAAAEMQVGELTGEEGPGDDSVKAGRFLRAITFSRMGAVWPYWWPEPGSPNRAEDVYHAGLDLVYARHAWERGWLDDSVMEALASTFAHRFSVVRGDMPYFVHGVGKRTPAGIAGRPSLALWMLMSRWSSAIRPTFCAWVSEDSTVQTRPDRAAILLAIAMLREMDRHD